MLTMNELSEITEHLVRFAPDALIVIDDQDNLPSSHETVP